MKSERDLGALAVDGVGSESDLEAMALRSRSASIKMNRAMSVLNAAANLPNRLKVNKSFNRHYATFKIVGHFHFE